MSLEENVDGRSLKNSGNSTAFKISIAPALITPYIPLQTLKQSPYLPAQPLPFAYHLEVVFVVYDQISSTVPPSHLTLKATSQQRDPITISQHKHFNPAK